MIRYTIPQKIEKLLAFCKKEDTKHIFSEQKTTYTPQSSSPQIVFDEYEYPITESFVSIQDERKTHMPGTGHSLLDDRVVKLLAIQKNDSRHIFSSQTYTLQNERKMGGSFFRPIIPHQVMIDLMFQMYMNRNLEQSMIPTDLVNVKQPLRKSAFDAMCQKERKYIEKGDTTCTVCLEDFQDTDVVKQTICNHTFHPTCLEQWVKDNHSCPNCKGSLGEYNNVSNGQILS